MSQFTEIAIVLMCGFVIGVEHRWKQLMDRKAQLLEEARVRFDEADVETVALIGDLESIVRDGRSALAAFAAAQDALDGK